MTTTLTYPEAPPECGRGARVDGELKVSGQLLYADDLALPGLLYVTVVRSPYPHARITSIDVSAARDEADRIVSEAQDQARQIRLEAEDYVDAKLAQYEIALERTANEAP